MKARRALQALCIAASVLSAMPSQAARSFTPQPGTWVVTSELNGKPGRGLAIDVQGNAFLMQVFAYEASGAATFYTAMGTLDGGAVTAPLIRYVGGRSFGGEPRSAEFRESLGNVVLRFTDGLHGVVQFPGEPELAIQRFTVMSTEFETLYVRPATISPRSFRMVGLDGNGQPAMAWDAQLVSGTGIQRQLLLKQTTAGANAPQQKLACSRREGMDAYDCKALEPAAAGSSDSRVSQASLRFSGPDVQGVVEAAGAVGGRFGVQGEMMAGGTISAWGDCSEGSYTYMQDISCYSGDVQIPSNGTWMVTDEINGKPGRGIAVDIQNGLAIAQVFNYLGNGGTTFHMGSGAYSEQETRLALQRYEGGRAIGGAMQSAALVNSPGEMTLGFYRLDDRTKRGLRTEGVVRFPEENQKSTIRLVLEDQSTLARRLSGQWLMNFQSPGGQAGMGMPMARVVTFNQDQGDVVASVDGAVQCRPVQNIAASAEVICDWHADAGKGAVLGSAHFVLQPNNRTTSAMRIRDQHGNLTGLGAWE